MTVVGRERIATISPAAHLAAWEHLDVGVMPLVLRVPDNDIDGAPIGRNWRPRVW